MLTFISKSGIKLRKYVVQSIFSLTRTFAISEIGVNLSDRMYQGEYNGSKKHEADLLQVLDRAWQSGLKSMIITGGSLSDAANAIELSKQEGIYNQEFLFNRVDSI